MKVKVKFDKIDSIWPIMTFIRKVNIDESQGKSWKKEKTDCIWPIMTLIAILSPSLPWAKAWGSPEVSLQTALA